MLFRAELLWRELERNMTVCPKCEIQFGCDEKAKNILLLAADATRKVVKKLFSKMCFFLKPEATWALLDRHTIWTFSGMPIRGVARFSETVENKPFSTPRARPEQVRFGPRTRRLFRRPLQRTVRFGSILQREHQKAQPL